MTSTAYRIERSVNRWLTTPESNAAGRLGLYRIIYALAALIYVLPPSQYRQIALIPDFLWRPVLATLWLKSPPSMTFLTAVECFYIGSLVLLLVGLCVRLMTLIVLISGTLFTAILYSFGKLDHSDTFMRVYLPVVMLFSPWGATYSLDAVLRQRRGQLPPAVSADSLRYSWPFLFLFWWLCIMFSVGGITKAIPPGQWIVDLNTLSKIMKEANLVLNPSILRHQFSELPIVPTLVLWMGLAFELSYPLAVINKNWRRFYLSSTIFFHMGTFLTLGIRFTFMLPFYIIFFDLYGLYARFFPKRLWILPSRFFARWSSPMLVGGSMLLAVVTVMSHYVIALKPIFRLPIIALENYGWYLAIILAVYGPATSLPKMLAGLRGKTVQSKVNIDSLISSETAL
ncbi:MAG: HTTM domain-containing protein [Chitinophagaceae bacterium]|nr:HTTM domain-containing protein [Anaerolineae bacterium]